MMVCISRVSRVRAIIAGWEMGCVVLGRGPIGGLVDGIMWCWGYIRGPCVGEGVRCKIGSRGGRIGMYVGLVPLVGGRGRIIVPVLATE
jgi:hypothetical protein